MIAFVTKCKKIRKKPQKPGVVRPSAFQSREGGCNYQVSLRSVLPRQKSVIRSPGSQPSAEPCVVLCGSRRVARHHTQLGSRRCGVFCAHLSTAFMLESARAEPVAKQRWRGFSEHFSARLSRTELAERQLRGAGPAGEGKKHQVQQDRVLGISCPPLLCPPPAPRAPQEQYLQLPCKTQPVFRVDHNHCPNSELFLFALLSYYLTWSPPEEDIATAVISSTPTEVREKKKVHFPFLVVKHRKLFSFSFR